MMENLLRAACPKCGEHQLRGAMSSAWHDDKVLDIIVQCVTAEGGCGYKLNAFCELNNMIEVYADD